MASRRKTARNPKRKPVARLAKPSREAALEDYMTRSVHTVRMGESLARAHELMNEHRIRHLPVLDGSRLVGMLSQRDLYFVESLANDKPEAILVEEAMSQDVFEAPVTSRLADVVSTMLAKKYGCAVVTDAGKVVGVFSTIDALRALLKRL